jgi:hypothetical protein
MTDEVEAACDARVGEVKEHHRACERRLIAAQEANRASQEVADRAQSRLFEVSSQAEARLSASQVAFIINNQPSTIVYLSLSLAITLD